MKFLLAISDCSVVKSFWNCTPVSQPWSIKIVWKIWQLIWIWQCTKTSSHVIFTQNTIYLYASARCKHPNGESFQPRIGPLLCRVCDTIQLVSNRFTDGSWLSGWHARHSNGWSNYLLDSEAATLSNSFTIRIYPTASARGHAPMPHVFSIICILKYTYLFHGMLWLNRVEFVRRARWYHYHSLACKFPKWFDIIYWCFERKNKKLARV